MGGWEQNRKVENDEKFAWYGSVISESENLKAFLHSSNEILITRELPCQSDRLIPDNYYGQLVVLIPESEKYSNIPLLISMCNDLG